MKLILFGADGYCGWPAALYLSQMGHEVVIADNLSRRKIDIELGTDSLTPIRPIDERLEVWNQLTGETIRFRHIDIAEEYERILELFLEERPDAIVHYAEQRAAPYSMRGPYQKMFTIKNNLLGTHNLLLAIVESGLDIHLVHLGSMGVYGYFSRDSKVPEGYIDLSGDYAEDSEESRRTLCLGTPSSVYHVTKMQDALLFQFYNINDKVRITDLHQGVVWGTNTPETLLDERLINRFDYDGDFGTFINRFFLQAALGMGITVYGNGGQCRPIIHMTDSIRCIELALLHPPRHGQPVQIYNQMTEVYQIRDVAKIAAEKTGAEIVHIENPRVENEECWFEVDNSTLLRLGLKPTKFSDVMANEIIVLARTYAGRLNESRILPKSRWSKRRRASELVLRALGNRMLSAANVA